MNDNSKDPRAWMVSSYETCYYLASAHGNLMFYKVFILSSWQVIHVSIYGEFQKEIGLNFHAYIYKIL